MHSEIFSFAFVILFANVLLGVASQIEKDRFLAASSISFTTFTLIKRTTTLTSTLITTSTCTTSTAALTTCTVGRRRRGLFYDEAESQGRHRHGLFFNDDEANNKGGSDFLPASERKNNDPVNEVSIQPTSDQKVIPLEIQPGHSSPEGSDSSRFLLAFGTSTITSLSISTRYVSLTAICSSTSGFPLCGGVGK